MQSIPSPDIHMVNLVNYLGCNIRKINYIDAFVVAGTVRARKTIISEYVKQKLEIPRDRHGERFRYDDLQCDE